MPWQSPARVRPGIVEARRGRAVTVRMRKGCRETPSRSAGSSPIRGGAAIVRAAAAAHGTRVRRGSMPANLTPVYKEAEARYKAAVTGEEKLAALEEMLRVIPKHKGTEKLQADLRSRISKLKRAPAGKAGGAHGHSYRIPAEGAGQVVLVGPPNTGKSALVARLTHAEPLVAEYPMSTREATPGMMPFGDISFQLVDLPPVCEEHVEYWVYDLIRGGDLAWVVLSVDDPLGGLELVERLLEKKAVKLVPWRRAAAAAEPPAPGKHADDEPAEERRPGWKYLSSLLVLTGLDRPQAREDLTILAELLGADWVWTAVASVTGEGLGALGDLTFDARGIIRVYTKEPGHDPDLERPFTLPVGATVGQLARTIHGEIAEHLKYARLWGKTTFDGQRVKSEQVLTDGDVVELRA
ncbi:MAG: TGS domain-containing protein [Gemmatimonadetes bacterium]|nr:TGS domain-containing protein [Gemmatimonadota bacterium]